jgi:hypothetical protein
LLPRYRFFAGGGKKRKASLILHNSGQTAVTIQGTALFNGATGALLNGATGANTGLDGPAGYWQGLFIGSLLAVCPRAARSEFCGPRESILRAGSLAGV